MVKTGLCAGITQGDLLYGRDACEDERGLQGDRDA